MARSFERHARTFTLLTLVSRLTGFARDALLTRVFGRSAIMDAFNLAFQVPNLFRRLFGEGALTASFLPVYTKLDRDDPALARHFAGAMLATLTLMLAGITVAGEAILALLRALEVTEPLGLELLMVMLPYMPLVCLVALVGAMLQTHDRFGPSAASPIILNLCVVAAALFGSHYGEQLLGIPHIEAEAHIRIVAWSVMVAGVLQLAWNLWALRHYGIRPHLRLRETGAHMREVVLKALPMLLGMGIFQVNTFVDGLVASYQTFVGPTIFGVPYPLEPGSMTTLSCGQRLYEFPLGVFGVAIATAIFPALARESNEPERFVGTLRRGLRLSFFIGFPASIGLVLLRDPLSATVFQGGKFSYADAQRVGFILMMYAPAIWAYSMQQLVTRAFYALGDTTTPVRISLWMVALNFALNMVLIWTPLREGGLAASTAIAAIVQIVVMTRTMRARLGPVVDAEVRRSMARTVVASLAMGAIVWLASLAFAGRTTWAWNLAATLTLSGVGGVAFLAASRVLRMPELGWAIRGRSPA
ncbi:MAG: murein biosynthesis integral membrane protein MurJ [Phycisphaerales bacterium]